MPSMYKRFSDRGERLIVYFDPLDCLIRLAGPALRWSNHLSTYLLGSLDPVWVSLMTGENTNYDICTSSDCQSLTGITKNKNLEDQFPGSPKVPCEFKRSDNVRVRLMLSEPPRSSTSGLEKLNVPMLPLTDSSFPGKMCAKGCEPS